MSISGGLESSCVYFKTEEFSGVACMCVLSISEVDLYVQLTLEQHTFEPHGSTYSGFFFPVHTTGLLHDPWMQNHCMEGWRPNPQAVQGSAVFNKYRLFVAVCVFEFLGLLGYVFWGM